MVNRRGLLWLLLLGDVSLNPGPLTLGVQNARCVRNKGPHLPIWLLQITLTFSALWKPIFVRLIQTAFYGLKFFLILFFLTGPHPSGIGGGVGFFIRSSYRPHKIESPFYQSFENMVVSIGLHGRSLLLACIYRPPGSCTCNFLEEFMSFVGFLSSINSSYYIYGDFNIHVVVPVGDGYKFMTFLHSCDLKQFYSSARSHIRPHSISQ